MKDNMEQNFERLESLYSRLPEMEEKSVRLLRAAAAEKLWDANRRLSLIRNECEGYEKSLRKGRETGDMGLQRYASEVLSLKRGPLAQAEAEVKKLLGESGFESLEMAEKSRLTSGEREDLDREIESFKKEYLELLELCRQAEEEN